MNITLHMKLPSPTCYKQKSHRVAVLCHEYNQGLQNTLVILRGSVCDGTVITAYLAVSSQ